MSGAEQAARAWLAATVELTPGARRGVLVRELAAGRRHVAALLATRAPAATGVAPDGCAVVAAGDVPVVIGALADAARCHLAHGGDSGVVPAYRRLSRDLGDDR